MHGGVTGKAREGLPMSIGIGFALLKSPEANLNLRLWHYERDFHRKAQETRILQALSIMRTFKDFGWQTSSQIIGYLHKYIIKRGRVNL
jgi:hypothetical protein